MRKVKIITDSCSDLTGELMDKYDIDYVKMNTVYEGVETPADLRWSYEDMHNLYETIRAGNRITTTQVPVEEFERVFTKYLELGFDIIYIACCIKQSGSINTGAVVAKKLLENYTEASIYCMDLLHSAIGQGMLAIKGAEYAAEGHDAKETAEYLDSIKLTCNEFVAVHTLDHLKKAGRVSASSAFFGNLFGVKPIIISDADGNQAAFKKVKGRQNSIREIVALLKEAMPQDCSNETVFIAHADCSDEEVNFLTDLVKSEIAPKEIITVYIGPIIGASVGPDTIGVWGFGKEVTFRSGEQK